MKITKFVKNLQHIFKNLVIYRKDKVNGQTHYHVIDLIDNQKFEITVFKSDNSKSFS